MPKFHFVTRSLLVCLLFLFPLSLSAQVWVRVNQLGYLPQDHKVAVLIATQDVGPAFQLCDARSGKVVFSGQGQVGDGSRWKMSTAYRLDFSAWQTEGAYYIEAGGTRSPNFVIATDVYEGAADYLLRYMRQQRCGDNPYLDTCCHQHDGFIVDHPTRTGEQIDVRGGWHDATDYLQYLTTSANATYQMMFAYMQHKDKGVFKDYYNASGRPGSNGIPDILDEIRWGLEWLLRMNPAPGEMYNQIADDRDHAGFRLPNRDKVDYGWGPGTGRPVYFITGERQGLPRPDGRIFYNRTTGVASSASKFASSFALGASLFQDLDPDFARLMQEKAGPAYDFAVSRPGNTQTACVVSPYFYEEDNYVDDVELAAATFYALSKDEKWRTEADYWGQLEPITPWMELGRARHYQFYPFVNLGHYLLAASENAAVSKKYATYMRQGLEAIQARTDVFLNGVPFVWCSNNLIAAAITQSRLYREATQDTSFEEMETALRDWLLGCNPWGTSMIVGYPAGGDFPEAPHASYLLVNGDLTYGGLVDGPIWRETHEAQIGIVVPKDNEYAPFNHGVAIYNDVIGDYASNEPTMDGTASLSYYFGFLEAEGKRQAAAIAKENKAALWGEPTDVKDRWGAVVRRNPEEKVVYLMFSADSMFQGGETVLNALKKHKAQASFFLTGNCVRMQEHKALVQRIIKEGHYVGPHSDKHLLYSPWEDRSVSLVSPDSLRRDLLRNVEALAAVGVPAAAQTWYLPPYEYYNDEAVKISENVGLKVLNLTPGSLTNSDYTDPSMRGYRPSQQLFDHVLQMDEKGQLSGALLLIHPGVVDSRPDKFYDRLDELMTALKKRGYRFDRIKN